MERRKAIKNLGRSMGAFMATPAILELLQSCQGPQPSWAPLFYTEEEGVFIKMMVDTLLPAVDELPSASEVNVHVFLDKFGKEIFTEGEQLAYKRLLAQVMDDLLVFADEDKISNLKKATYESWLDQVFARSMTDEVYAFLKDFRDQTIWAYKNSELVGETIMAYNPIPGKYEGCVDLMDTTGGKAWSI